MTAVVKLNATHAYANETKEIDPYTAQINPMM
jgi:hypothetical protein